MKVIINPTARETAVAVTRRLLTALQTSKDEFFHLAISGGSTPLQLFHLWANEYNDMIPWERIHLYWVDERCVSPDHSESNYGEAKRAFLERVPMMVTHIHRIYGEANETDEAARYSSMVSIILPMEGGIPIFDMVILGVGNDGHTGSIFPGQDNLFHYPSGYAVSRNPYTSQSRITMTGEAMMRAKCLLFHVVGAGKKEVLPLVIGNAQMNPVLPAAYISHEAKHCEFYIDKGAAELIPEL
ncbi:MAG: 6-phosphogluconolactonase [Bacteroidales bacterium]